MSAFNVAVHIRPGGDPTVQHSVALAMEPYRGSRWTWYDYGSWGWGSSTAAFIDGAGQWHEREGLTDREWDAEVGEYLPEVLADQELIILKCKD